MHGYDMLWLMFLIVAAEAGRYWQPSPSGVSEPMRRGGLIIAERRPRPLRGRRAPISLADFERDARGRTLKSS